MKPVESSMAVQTPVEKKPSPMISNRNRFDSRSKCVSYAREKIHHFMAKSSMHGLPNIVDAQGFILKSLWALCLLGSVTVCFYFVFLSISNFLDFDVTTTTTTVVEIPAQFPQVTICNVNPFMTNESTEFIDLILKQNNLSSTQSSNDILLNQIFYRYFIGVNSQNKTEDFRKLLGLQLDEMMISCTYSMQPCSLDDFVWYWDIIYGNCYKFNSHGNVTSHKPGIFHGLQIELYVGQPSISSADGFMFGARVVVNNYSFFPSWIDGSFVQPGSYTAFAVSRENHERLPFPYSDCEPNIKQLNAGLVQPTIKQFGSYSQTNCFDMCFQSYVVKKCGCLDQSGGNPFNYSIPFCLNITQVNCDFAFYAEFYSNNPDKYCGDLCPQDCNENLFSLTISSAGYPSISYAEKLANHSVVLSHYSNDSSLVTYQSLRDNVLAINIHYTKLSYTMIKESPSTTWIDLIGSVGGTLGLFTGISFLSFVELVELQIYLISAFIRFLLGRKNQQRVTHGIA